MSKAITQLDYFLFFSSKSRLHDGYDQFQILSSQIQLCVNIQIFKICERLLEFIIINYQEIRTGMKDNCYVQSIKTKMFHSVKVFR